MGQKSSSKNSVTLHKNRVQWTRFPCMENEFIELVFPMVLDSNEVPVVCLIRYLTACGFAWSDNWLRLHLCFHTWKTSSINSLSDQANHRNFVRIKHHRENEFNELVFHTWKTSSMNSFSIHGNRVLWTRFLCFVPHQFSRKSSHLDSNCYKWNKFETLSNL